MNIYEAEQAEEIKDLKAQRDDLRYVNLELEAENKVLRGIVESAINSTAEAIKKCQEINIFND